MMRRNLSASLYRLAICHRGRWEQFQTRRRVEAALTGVCRTPPRISILLKRNIRILGKWGPVYILRRARRYPLLRTTAASSTWAITKSLARSTMAIPFWLSTRARGPRKWSLIYLEVKRCQLRVMSEGMPQELWNTRRRDPQTTLTSSSEGQELANPSLRHLNSIANISMKTLERTSNLTKISSSWEILCLIKTISLKFQKTEKRTRRIQTTTTQRKQRTSTSGRPSLKSKISELMVHSTSRTSISTISATITQLKSHLMFSIPTIKTCSASKWLLLMRTWSSPRCWTS